MRPKPSPFASRSVSLAGPGGVLRAIAPTHGGSRGALVRAGCAPLSLDTPRAGTVQVPHAGIRDTWAGPALRSRPPVGFASADSITADGKQHFRIPSGSSQAAWKMPFGIRAESADWKGRL